MAFVSTVQLLWNWLTFKFFLPWNYWFSSVIFDLHLIGFEIYMMLENGDIWVILLNYWTLCTACICSSPRMMVGGCEVAHHCSFWCYLFRAVGMLEVESLVTFLWWLNFTYNYLFCCQPNTLIVCIMVGFCIVNYYVVDADMW